MSDPWRKIVLDMNAKTAVKKPSAESRGKFVVVAIEMSTDPSKLRIRFGTGHAMKLVSREFLDCFFGNVKRCVSRYCILGVSRKTAWHSELYLSV